MKKVILILASLWIAHGIQAQNNNGLKGPQAKNYQVLKEFKSTPVVTRNKPLDLKGPAAKNYQRRGLSKGVSTTPVITSPRMSLKGPGAKNYQPRIKKSSPNIFRHSNRNEGA